MDDSLPHNVHGSHHGPPFTCMAPSTLLVSVGHALTCHTVNEYTYKQTLPLLSHEVYFERYVDEFHHADH